MVDLFQTVRYKLFQIYSTVLCKYDKHIKQLVVRPVVYKASGLAGALGASASPDDSKEPSEGQKTPFGS